MPKPPAYCRCRRHPTQYRYPNSTKHVVAVTAVQQHAAIVVAVTRQIDHVVAVTGLNRFDADQTRPHRYRQGAEAIVKEDRVISICPAQQINAAAPVKEVEGADPARNTDQFATARMAGAAGVERRVAGYPGAVDAGFHDIVARPAVKRIDAATAIEP